MYSVDEKGRVLGLECGQKGHLVKAQTISNAK